MQLLPDDVDNKTLYYNRGCALFLMERNKESIEDLSRAIELDPKYAKAYLKRGSIYEVTQEYELCIIGNMWR